MYYIAFIQLQRSNLVKIIGIETSSNFTGIQIVGFDQVEAALRCYNGEIKAPALATATSNELVNAVSKESGPLAAGLLLNAMDVIRDRQGDFVGRMISQAKQNIKQTGHFHASYDYDAMGTSFFKTSIDISLIDKKDDVYLLKINAAYVGNEPEKELAKSLGYDQALFCGTVTLKTEPLSSERFKIDFNLIAQPLSSFFNLKNLTGQAICKGFAFQDRYGETPGWRARGR